MTALTPERAVRLLRAKAAELEQATLAQGHVAGYYLAADIALVASLLADHIEAVQP